MKIECVDGSIQNGLGHPILLSLILEKLAGYKVFYEFGTIRYNKLNWSVLTTITLGLEDDDIEEFNFMGETLTFFLQLMKISFFS